MPKLTKPEKVFVLLALAAAVLCAGLAFAFAVPLKADSPQALPQTDDLADYLQVDLNTADVQALCSLPGIGEKRAQAIVEYRTQYGPFEQVEDAASVPGITPELVASWAGRAFVRTK